MLKQLSMHGCHCLGNMAVRLHKVLPRLWGGVQVYRVAFIFLHVNPHLGTVIKFLPLDFLHVKQNSMKNGKRH